MPDNNDSQVEKTPHNYANILNLWKSREQSQSGNNSNPEPNDPELIEIDQALPQHAALIETGEKIIKSLYNNSLDTTMEEILNENSYSQIDWNELNQTNNQQSHMEKSDTWGQLAQSTLKTALNTAYHAANTAGSTLNPIVWGKSIKRQIQPENKIPDQRGNYLKGIVAIMWFIFGQAKEKQGKTVERGSFKIIDPGNKLYDLLLQYVTLANHGAVASATSKSIFSYNDFAYTRSPELCKFPVFGYGGLSSHYREDPEQYGIDIRFHGGEELSFILPPGNHGHLLFGKTTVNNQSYTFLKCEEFGLGSMLEGFLHGTDYARKMGESNPGGSFREKDIPQELITIYRDFCLATNQQPVAEKQPLYEIAKTVLHTNINDNTAAQKYKNNFIEQLGTLGLAEHHNIQHGNEVILDFNALVVRAVTKEQSPTM